MHPAICERDYMYIYIYNSTIKVHASQMDY